MLRPTYIITLGNAEFSSTTLGPLMALEVTCAKNNGGDEALILLGRTSEVDPEVGGDVTIELGWDGGTELVFTGSIEAVDRGVGALEVACVGRQMKLLRARGDQTFVNQAAGQVVSVLAGDAGVETDAVEDGISLPVYLADSSMTAYDHCLGLARRCGFDLYTTEAGKLVFARYSGSRSDCQFQYGVHIVSASVEHGTPPGRIVVVPESPASSVGEETSSWFIKDPSSHQVEKGDAALTLMLSDSVLRTKEAAEIAAQARLTLSQQAAVLGHVELMGDSEVHLGNTVELVGIPDAGVDGLYQVMAVRHSLNRRRGFRTVVTLGGIPA